MTQTDQQLHLRPGDWVQIRSEAEILSALDDNGTFEGLPFMPEMLPFCGERFEVLTRTERSCDPTSPAFMRHIRDTVHLKMLRCDGSCHEGCQSGCLMFWKEAWLKRTSPSGPGASLVSLGVPQASAAPSNGRDRAWLESKVHISAPHGGSEISYRCQATGLKDAGPPLPWWKPAQYLRDLRANQLPLAHLIRTFGYMAITLARRAISGKDYPDVTGQLDRTPSERLDLRPGEWITVKSREEIIATLDKTGRNRGLTFEATMLPFCGNRYRVLRRVDRIIDERTGQLRQLREPSVILDGVLCTSLYRRACSRCNHLFWREIWLKRDEPAVLRIEKFPTEQSNGTPAECIAAS
jgi:hypothetical protein